MIYGWIKWKDTGGEKTTVVHGWILNWDKTCYFNKKINQKESCQRLLDSN